MKQVGKIYSAVDADELEAGDIVVCGDNLFDAGDENEEPCVLLRIESERDEYRFVVANSFANRWALARLVCPKKHAEVYKAWKAGAKVEMYGCYSRQWHIVSDPMWEEDNEYRVLEEKDPFAELKKAYNEGRTIQFYNEVHSEWEECPLPNWSSCIQYRIKPNSKKENSFKELKKAYAEGKTIQILTVSGEWIDIEEPSWEDVNDYRIKPEPEKRRMTLNELAKWLAQGNGQVCNTNTESCSTYIAYYKSENDNVCSPYIRIRAWDEEEWHEPLVEE